MEPPLIGTLKNSVDPGSELFANIKTNLSLTIYVGTIHHDLENSTFDHLKYIMGCPIFIISVCTGKSIGMKRANPCSSIQDIT